MGTVAAVDPRRVAVVIVTMSHIYLSGIVFLTGVQLDSLIRRQVDHGDPE